MENFTNDMAVTESGAQVPPTGELIYKVAATIRRFIFFKHQRMPLLIATWILNTHLHRRFNYCGYLWIHSPVMRCGKTTLLEIINRLAWSPSGVRVGMTPATLYRLVDAGCTLIMDEMENLKESDKRQFSLMIAIFNAGFAEGATLPRMVKGEVQDFSVYGPKVISGINTVTDTIRDRSFGIKMVRKAKEKTEKFNKRIHGNQFTALRSLIELWAEENGLAVQQIYDAMAGNEPALQNYDDRFIDVAEPLLAILKFATARPKPAKGPPRPRKSIKKRRKKKTKAPGLKRLRASDSSDGFDGSDTSTSEDITDKVISLLRELGEQRSEIQVDESIVAVCEVLDRNLGGNSRTFVESERLLQQLRQTPPLRRITSTRALSMFLSRFDLNPRRDTTGRKRGYWVSKEDVADIRLRYTSEPSEPSAAQQAKRLSKKR